MNKLPTIVAIGGGELKDLETLPIDRAIVKLAKKKQPKALFIPTASNDALGYWETFQEIYGKRLKCLVDVLFLACEKPSKKEIAGKILSADIIYVGGGYTLRMLRIWRKYGVDTVLRKAHEKGIVLTGLSAGAIAWFRYGTSDSRRFMRNRKGTVTLMRVSALDLLPFLVSPHHIHEKTLRESGIKAIMRRTPGVALALDDNAAILVQGDRYKILRSKPGVGIKKVFRKNRKIEIKPLRNSGTLGELSARR